uniref:Uncharacterized protein n=1 Tax=Nelumbo nucifera TaxID=4432 RepID=A0A822XSX0_NELNU|nr:TPA_asm: hypothetical protein HUJ06_022011 [Nelumbo nucifera]
MKQSIKTESFLLNILLDFKKRKHRHLNCCLKNRIRRNYAMTMNPKSIRLKLSHTTQYAFESVHVGK